MVISMYEWKRYVNVVEKDNLITINRCNHPKCASDFLYSLQRVIRRGFSQVQIRIKASSVFPNACVPIRGIIEHYCEQGIIFDYDIEEASYLSKCSFVNPLNKSKEELMDETQPFDKLFYYCDPGQVAYITAAYVNAISHQSVCGEGVLRGLEWCVSEVMDNVLLHSEAGHGLVMAQYHPSTQKIVICIYDDGIGIFNSLKNSKHKPRTEIDAISLSLQEGVGDGKGQGNGLYGLYKIVHENEGTLTITSGKSSIMLSEGEIKKFEKVPYISDANRGTIVDFQLNLKKGFNLMSAFESIGGLDDFDVRIDNMLNDDDLYVYDVFQNCQGTGTRHSGESIRNDVENILKRIKTGIVLDFGGVKMVSSSFIDEFIAKMFIDLGFMNFNSLVRIINMVQEVKFLCERSLYIRIHDDWNELMSKDDTDDK